MFTLTFFNEIEKYASTTSASLWKRREGGLLGRREKNFDLTTLAFSSNGAWDDPEQQTIALSGAGFSYGLIVGKALFSVVALTTTISAA